MLSILLIAFFFLVIVSLPVATALGVASVAAAWYEGAIPLTLLPHKMVGGVDSFVFVSIPLFLLAGRLMNACGITDRLFDLGRTLAGRFYGGLAQANVLASMMFAWMSGSAVAAVGGLGEIEVKAMKDNGYDVPFAASVATAASVLGPIIPPSIPLIIYGAMTEVAIGRLFLAGVLPGLLMGASLMVLIRIMAKKRGYPRDAKGPPGAIILATKRAALPLVMPLLILGGILSGWFTPTEAAAVAVVYAFFLGGFVYRTLRWKDIPEILVDTMVTTAVVTFIISTTSAFSYLLAIEDAAQVIGQSILALTDNKWLILLLVNVLLLILGAVMEAGVVLILFTPILYPIALSVGIDPVHFGVVMVVNLMIGVATPPVGMCLFVMSNIARIRVEVLMRAIIPFLVPLLVALLIITYWPGFVMFLPDLLLPS